MARISFANQKIYQFGEKGSGFRIKGEPQDFYKIKDQCVRDKVLFEDSQFPASNESLFHFSQKSHLEWRRPGQIVPKPQFFVEGYSRFDVRQGELGDCWLLAAIANLTLHKDLFLQVVPDDQNFSIRYAGVFHFRFWQYGRWIDVVIDDRLPTYNGKLIYMHSTEVNEFWSALLEKAYAKLHGSYEALKGGSTCEGMEDFTGGVTETYEIKSAPSNLFEILLKAYERSSLIACSLEADPNIVEDVTPQGLVKGHAYSITCVKYIEIQNPKMSGKIPLLRIRNPWGNEAEWNGAWSDRSPEWKYISEKQKQEMGLTFNADGEFWMSFKDFTTYYALLEICNLNPDNLEEETRKKRKKNWQMSNFEGEWVRGVTAGGCRNFLDTFANNPQYRITLVDPDDNSNDDKCTVVIALMQKNRRQQRKMGVDCLTIGYVIYHLKSSDNSPKHLNTKFFKYNACKARSPTFSNLREISGRFRLPRGSYCVVPSTYDPNEEAEFLMRVFSENENNMIENEEPIGMTKMSKQIVENVQSGKKMSFIEEKLICCGDSSTMEEERLTPEEQEELKKSREFFLNIAGEDLEVDWMELKEILNSTMKEELECGFSNDVCRSMVAMMDADYSGKLGFEEFKHLWKDIKDWTDVYKMYETSGTHQLSAFQLREALHSAGYIVNSHILNIIGHRYGTKEGNITFDDFIMCAVRLKTMIDLFREKDPEETGSATFSLEEWLHKTVYS